MALLYLFRELIALLYLIRELIALLYSFRELSGRYFAALNETQLTECGAPQPIPPPNNVLPPGNTDVSSPRFFNACLTIGADSQLTLKPQQNESAYVTDIYLTSFVKVLYAFIDGAVRIDLSSLSFAQLFSTPLVGPPCW
jgi:hypothetical protein